MGDEDDEDDDAMPAPTVRQRPEEDGAIGALSDRLEQAARSAMGRLRSIRSEQEAADEPARDEDPGSDDDA